MAERSIAAEWAPLLYGVCLGTALDLQGRSAAEVGGQHQRGGVGRPVEQAAPGGTSLGRVLTEATVVAVVVQLQGAVEDVAGEQGAVAAGRA